MNNFEKAQKSREKTRKSLSDKDGVDIIRISYWQTEKYIFEEIFNPNFEPEIQYAVFDKDLKTITYQTNFELENGKIIRPLELALVSNKNILLPSEASIYESESALLEEIEEFINTYLDLSHPFYLKLVSHYILLTWVYDKLSVVPYLRAIGDYGSGKTRFAVVIGSLSYKGLFIAGASSDAFIFRIIELFKGTLIVNELERVNTDIRSQIVIILNNGYEKGLSVGKIEGDRKRVPVTFDIFSPKIITTREKFKDLALESRILSIPMQPTHRKDIHSLLDDPFWIKAQELRNKLLTYRFNKLNAPVSEGKEKKLFKLEPRLRQTLLPIFYVIQSERTEEEFIKYATEFQEQVFSDRNLEIDSLIAEKLIKLFDGDAKVTIKAVTEEVNLELDEKEKLTNKAVGQKVRLFGFKTKKSGGVFHIIYDKEKLLYLRDRYNFSVENPQNPPDPQSDSASNGDVDDIRDFVNEEFGTPIEPRTECRTCNGRRFWKNKFGDPENLICAKCHPPTSEGQVLEWIGEEPDVNS